MTIDLPPDKAADVPLAEAVPCIPVPCIAAPCASWLRRIVGTALLGLCLGVSLLLAAEQLDRLRLPGCTAQSSCGALTAGPWGKLPFREDAGFSWPVSFLGVAYFGGLLAAWLLAPRGGLSSSVRWLARLGLAGSLGFAGIMYWERTFCAYCAVVHAGNVAFWLVAETTAAAGFLRRPAIAFVCTAAVASAALGWGQARLRQQVAEQANVLLQASIRQVIDISRREAQPATDRPAFRGRYGRGPAQSPVRVLIFTDYQCAHCREWDRQLTQALAAYDSMAFSVKHFPLCPECNAVIAKQQNSHPNACRAAWAAEAAGVLRGHEGFWAMHRWLFERGGQFTDEQLTAALGSLGFGDASKFLAIMSSDGVRASVEHDVQEAAQVGLQGTPTLFINGVQVVGVSSVAALHDMLATLHAADLPPRTADFDRPALVADSYYDEWCKRPAVSIPVGKCRWQTGPDDAPIRVVLFFDCHQPVSARMAAQVREWTTKRQGVRAEFYHFPFTTEAHAPHRLVEAAGRIGGQAALWRMHDWFCGKGEDSTAEEGLAAAESLQMDRDKLAAEFALDVVRQAVDGDIRLGVACRIDGAPRMYINGRLVPQSAPPQELMDRIQAAAKGGEAAPK